MGSELRLHLFVGARQHGVTQPALPVDQRGKVVLVAPHGAQAVGPQQVEPGVFARGIGPVVFPQHLFLTTAGTVDLDGHPRGSHLVAFDAVGAGLGEIVLYAQGSSARQTVMTDGRPVDCTIMAIVDIIETGGQARYEKGSGSGST